VDGEAEGGLDQLVVRKCRAEGEDDPRDLARQLARQLDAPAIQEEVDDRQLEAESAQQAQGLSATSDDMDEIPATPQDGG
jgi:hypothetical protein